MCEFERMNSVRASARSGRDLIASPARSTRSRAGRCEVDLVALHESDVCGVRGGILNMVTTNGLGFGVTSIARKESNELMLDPLQ